MKNTQSGSALWFILMAIALLAALTIAITRTSNTAEQNGGVEHNRIMASQIMREGASLQTTVDQMRLRGISESDIDFDDPDLSGYTNPNCTSDDCKVFGPGGGLTYKTIAAAGSGSPWIFTGGGSIAGIGADNVPELVAALPVPSPSLCQAIDTAVGLSSIPSLGGSIGAIQKFVGTYGPNYHVALPTGKDAGCFVDDSGVYAFYQVLIAR